MNIAASALKPSAHSAVEIRIRGRVQGVGFRPLVWRHARELGLEGVVFNDAEGLLIRAKGSEASVQHFIARMKNEAPPLASVESLEVSNYDGELPSTFAIAESNHGITNTQIAPDAAMCADCASDIFDPFSRRFRYPFTTCTNCGPRLTIVERMPYDRVSTSMAAFDLCPACADEYSDPADRRFHAETTACHVCGPKARLIRFDGKAFSFEQSSMLDDVDGALGLIQKGEIIAIKGLGGFHLACDATRADAVQRLRDLKQRDRKPFALMAQDLTIIRRYCTVTGQEEQALTSPAAPIVLLRSNGTERLPDAIAPGLCTLGFMLPTTPLHALLLRRMNRPVVMTSGNVSNSPQVISDTDAKRQLEAIAPYALVHDRDIINRVDDSVVRVAAGSVRVLRRARGYAPSSVRLPPGFEHHPEILALGGDLKSAFCFAKNGAAVLSQHIGDLDDAATLRDLERSLHLYREMFDASPQLIVADLHPGYRSTALAAKLSAEWKAPVCQVQHHHAHIASCMAENGVALGAKPVLGIALDGLGYGLNGEIWGGEFLLTTYMTFERLATFKPVAMLGGDKASREPWRNLYAHLMAEMGWPSFSMNFSELGVFDALNAKPRKIVDTMLRDGVNAPKASSCGRLFDAAAAAMDVCFESQGYEGEAASLLEAIADQDTLNSSDGTLDYPFTIPRLKSSNLPYVEPLAVWNAILGDLILKTPVGVMSARFHRGLARVLCTMTAKLSLRDSEAGARFDTIVLSGGCFHNRILLELTEALLKAEGFEVLTQAAIPAGDGGLALGQTAIAAAQILYKKENKDVGGNFSCASESLDAL
jgi:hydrogenase maturation protein HypF